MTKRKGSFLNALDKRAEVRWKYVMLLAGFKHMYDEVKNNQIDDILYKHNCHLFKIPFNIGKRKFFIVYNVYIEIYSHYNRWTMFSPLFHILITDEKGNVYSSFIHHGSNNTYSTKAYTSSVDDEEIDNQIANSIKIDISLFYDKFKKAVNVVQKERNNTVAVQIKKFNNIPTISSAENALKEYGFLSALYQIGPAVLKKQIKTINPPKGSLLSDILNHTYNELVKFNNSIRYLSKEELQKLYDFTLDPSTLDNVAWTQKRITQVVKNLLKAYQIKKGFYFLPLSAEYGKRHKINNNMILYLSSIFGKKHIHAIQKKVRDMYETKLGVKYREVITDNNKRQVKRIIIGSKYVGYELYSDDVFAPDIVRIVPLKNIVRKASQYKHIVKDILPDEISKESLLEPKEKEVSLITKKSILKGDDFFVRRYREYLDR